MMGNPAVTMPAGVGAEGLPFGVQVIGPHRGDRFVLDACLALERLFASEPALSRPRPDLCALDRG